MNTSFRVEKPILGRPNASLKSSDAGDAALKFAPPAPPAAVIPKTTISPVLTSSQVEDVLRLFDLNPRYGPFIGIDRIERWQRAHRFGLDPPPFVHQLLTNDGANPELQWKSNALW